MSGDHYATEIQFANAWIKEHELADGGYIVKESNQQNLGSNPFEWSIGPLTVRILVDASAMKGSLDVYVSVPILGRTKVASVGGSLIDGITAKLDVKVISGSITLYYKDGFVRLKVEAKVLGTSYSKDIRLFAMGARKFKDFTLVLAHSDIASLKSLEYSESFAPGACKE